MHRLRCGAAALLLATLGALAACTPTPASTTLPPGVTVSFEQLRSDVVDRHAQVRIHNGGDTALRVTEVAVSDPRFDGQAVRVLDHASPIAAGATVDIRVQLPAMACPAAQAGSTVTLTYTVEGAQRTATAPLPDTLGFLSPLHQRECQAAGLAKALDATFSAFTSSEADSPAHLELTVTPTGEGEAALTGIRETNLLTFALPGEVDGTWPLDVLASVGNTTPVVVDLLIVPARCDEHAVMEDKRGTVFRVDTVVDGEPGTVEVAPDADLRGRLLSWVAHWCGYGP